MNIDDIKEVVGEDNAAYCEYAREMEYDGEKFDFSNVLARGSYKGFPFLAVSYNSHHPCGYVNVKGSPLQGLNYDEIEGVECHGGLTFSEDCLPLTGETGWWIGWDYNHYMDYNPTYEESGFVLKSLDVSKMKKWTTKEIVAECISVIDQVLKVRTKEECEPCPNCGCAPEYVRMKGRVMDSFVGWYDGEIVKMKCPKCGVYVEDKKGDKEYGYASEASARNEWNGAIRWRRKCQEILDERKRAKEKDGK